MAMICLSAESWKSWEKSGKAEFLRTCKTFVGTQTLIVENTETKDLKRALYELCWCGINGHLKPDQILNTLSDVAEMHPQVPSLVADLFSAIDVELMSTEDAESRERFVSVVIACQHLVTDNLLKERLDADTLENMGLVQSKTAFQQKYVKTKTKLYYKQQKFNLLREESEGYAKLITELNQDVSHDVVLQNIKSLIGCFNLDPNRILDIILESFECNPSQTELFVPLLREYAVDKETLCHVLGFKFHFYQQTEDSVTPASLYHVAALLLRHGLVDFGVLYSHLSPPNADIVDRCKTEMVAAKQYQRKSMVINLGDKSAPNDAKDAEKEKEEKIEPIANNQKFGLCEALIRIGAWEQAKSVMAAVPPFSVVSHKPVAQCLCQLIHYVIEPLYVEHSGIPKLILGKRQPVVRFEHVPQAASFMELPTSVFPMLRQLGPHLAADVTLVVKLNRLARNFVEKKTTLSLDETQYAEVFAGFLTVYDEAILPSLSLMPNNCCMSEEIWGFVKLLKYEHRYRLYGQWKNESRLGHPRLIRVHTDILDKAKYIMKRLAKENVKPLGRQLGKLSHSAPGIVFEYILSQIQKYDNFIGPVVDSLKFLTNMSYDVLLYCVIEALANPERERLKTDDTNISFWLQCLANFSGSVLKKYQVDIAGLLQYIANQLKAQKSYDLAILRDVVQKMAGIEVTEEMTDDQLSAMSGGELLRQEGGYFTQVRNTRKSSSRLMECLLEHDLAIPMCLLMAQQRQAIVFRHTLNATATQQIEDKRHIKLIGKLYDQCQDTLVQFINFMSLQLSADEIVARLPNIHELLTTYHIPAEVAFALWRIVYSSQISSKFEEMRKADKKDKTIVANSQTQKMIRYAEAIESVMSPIGQLVSPVYPPKVWEEISTSFYTTFWSLAMYDLHVPTAAYEKQMQIHKTQMALEEDSAAGKKKKEKERFTQLLDKLTDEEKRQQEHVKLVMARLRVEKETWFPSKTAKHSAITTVLQLCMFPRCCLTAVDAIFCAKFLYIMHNLKTPNFSSLICYDRIFTDITWALTSCTENEAHRYGRFLCGLLDDVMRWHADKSDFEKECLNYPGFVTVFRAPGTFTNFADQLDYENYRHVVHKWHYSLTRVSVNCLESGDYCQIRNMLIVLTKILPHYPRVSKLGQALERRVDRVIDEEKEKRQDLYVFALAYSGQLKSTKKTWQQDHEFHRKEPAEGKPGTQVKPTTPTGSAPSAAPAPAAAPGTGNITIKREPTSSSSEKRERQPVSSSSHDIKPSVAEKNPATSSSSATKAQGREADTTRRSDDRTTTAATSVVKTTPDARDPSKEPRDAGNSSKLKCKHKLSSSDLRTDGERVSKERRHDSAGREKKLDRGGGANPQQPAAATSVPDLAPEVETRRGEEKRLESRTERFNRESDDRMKERGSGGHRMESDTETVERSRSVADYDQSDEGSGTRSADGHRRSAETNVSSSSGKALDEREVKRRKVEVTSGSKESLGHSEPVNRMHKTPSLASSRGERGDRVGSSSSGRTVLGTDAERERKLQVRAEKLERKRINDALLSQAQTIPLNRAADNLDVNDLKHNKSDSATPPNVRDKSGKLNGSEPARGHRDGQRSHSREGDGSSRSRDSEPERVVRKKVDEVTPTTSLRALQRDHIRSKELVPDDPLSSKERIWAAKEEDNSPRERIRKDEANIRERHRPREQDIGLKDTIDEKDKRSSEKRLKKSKRH